MLCLKVFHNAKALGDLICWAFSFSAELLCSAESTKLSLTPQQFYLVIQTQPLCVFFKLTFLSPQKRECKIVKASFWFL